MLLILSQDYYVEIDVVMDANTPLWKAHDISQQLQDKIEVLPNVGRAFVHVDHETTHTPVSRLCYGLFLSSHAFSRHPGTPQERMIIDIPIYPCSQHATTYNFQAMSKKPNSDDL